MKKMQIVGSIAIAAIAGGVIAAPIASADGASSTSSPGNSQIVATPGQAASNAAQLQQPFGGDMGALLFHHH